MKSPLNNLRPNRYLLYSLQTLWTYVHIALHIQKFKVFISSLDTQDCQCLESSTCWRIIYTPPLETITVNKCRVGKQNLGYGHIKVMTYEHMDGWRDILFNWSHLKVCCSEKRPTYNSVQSPTSGQASPKAMSDGPALILKLYYGTSWPHHSNIVMNLRNNCRNWYKLLSCFSFVKPHPCWRK